MLSDEVRLRLRQIHRPAALRSPVGGRPLLLLPGFYPPPEAPRREPSGDELLAQAEECQNASGKHLRFRRPLVTLWPAAERAIGRTFERATTHEHSTANDVMHAELAAMAEHFPADALFLDLETCGFAGSPVFLAGLLWQDDEVLVLDQLFARNYTEERAVLESLWRIAARNRVLVTYNGKSFDWPMVHDRSTRHHLGRDARSSSQSADPAAQNEIGLGRHDPRPQLTHCDLLHHARRRWKRVLPNCKLQTLERFVCNRSRHDDLSGAQVPVAYHEFVRTGVARQVGAIVHHNALDLVTLMQIAIRLLEPDRSRR
jgi:uncharacterized protein YprB with RNaseH-like and TPR domain